MLRSWIAQEAIAAAEAGDLAAVRRVFDLVTRPHADAADADDERYSLPSTAVEGRNPILS